MHVMSSQVSWEGRSPHPKSFPTCPFVFSLHDNWGGNKTSSVRTNNTFLFLGCILRTEIFRCYRAPDQSWDFVTRNWVSGPTQLMGQEMHDDLHANSSPKSTSEGYVCLWPFTICLLKEGALRVLKEILEGFLQWGCITNTDYHTTSELK